MFRTGRKPPERWIAAGALLLVAIPYFVNLGVSSLWDANEAFYAGTPREMLESGDYLSPKFNYEVRAQKPPLTYWVVAASYSIFGIREFSVRLPGALAATGVMWFTWLMVRRRCGFAAGLVAMVAAGTCPRVFLLARRLPIDILLLFWLTGAAYFLLEALEKRRRIHWVLAYAFMAFGVMTKGPVALVIPGGALVLWLLWTRRARLAELRLLEGLATVLVIVLPWYLLSYARDGWAYIAVFFLRDNLGRFANEAFGPMRGPFYYFPAFFADAYPWSVVATALVLVLLFRPSRLRHLRDSWLSFPAAWCAWTFVLFSFSKNKQEYYIAPLYPLLAAGIAAFADRISRQQETEGGSAASTAWIWTQATLALLMSAAAAGAWYLLPIVFPDAGLLLHYPPVVLLVLTAALLAVSAVRGEGLGGFAALGAGQWLVVALVALVYVPAIEPLRPVRTLCASIDREFENGDEVGYYRATVPSMSFYLQRKIFEEFHEEPMERRFRSGRRVFCLMAEPEYQRLVGERELILYVLDRRERLVTQLGPLLEPGRRVDNDLLLVSNRPSPDSAAGSPQ